MPALFNGRLLASTALALGATLLTATIALASPPGWTPNSGDDRATAYAGNVTTCAEAGLPGDKLTLPGLEDATNTYVTITSADIPAGDTIRAVVVKGGPGYNVYQGLTAWTRLHSPINVGGQIPTISHWFACVTSKANGGGGTTTTTTTSPPAGGPTTTKTTSGSGGTTGNGSTGGSTSTTGHLAAAATTANTPGATTNLASTGFADGWLVWVGVLLLLVGAGAVVLTRTAHRRS